MDSRMKKLTQYVVPTILGNCAYFLFTIIDGILSVRASERTRSARSIWSGRL